MTEPTITDADREAAEQWRWSLYNSEVVSPTVQVEADLADLAADFAAHRIAAEIEGARKMREAAILKAHELYPTMEVQVMLLNLDPTTVIKGEEA